MNLSKMKTILLAAGVALMAISMILLPEESLEASIRGLNMWWGIVFPSLFPFFVISELLIGVGVVTFMGVILEPLMRPLFRVPGVGGFAWAMGMASGFPAGAKLTARLRQEETVDEERSRKVGLIHKFLQPSFYFRGCFSWFFQNPRLGIILALAHYLGNFLVGFTMRFYGEKQLKKEHTKPTGFLLSKALSALHRKRLENKKPIGKLVGDAVTSSIQTLLMIGGFIILFSVINKLLFDLQITLILAKLIGSVFTIFHLPSALSVPTIAGLFEITLGNQMTSKVQEASLMHKAIIASFILGFSGFSVQAQVASILAQTDIRFRPFFLARVLHGFVSGVLTFILWKPYCK